MSLKWQLIRLYQTTQIISGVSFTTAHVAYASTNKTSIVSIETKLFLFYQWRSRLVFTCVLGSYGAFTVLLVPKHFWGPAMTAPIDSCAEIKTAAYKPILVEFGGRCRKAMLGVSDKWFPSKAWSGSEYSHAFFAHCRKFLPCPNSLPSQPIHIFIFQLRWLWLSQFHVLVRGKNRSL